MQSGDHFLLEHNCTRPWWMNSSSCDDTKSSSMARMWSASGTSSGFICFICGSKGSLWESGFLLTGPHLVSSVYPHDKSPVIWPLSMIFPMWESPHDIDSFILLDNGPREEYFKSPKAHMLPVHGCHIAPKPPPNLGIPPVSDFPQRPPPDRNRPFPLH